MLIEPKKVGESLKTRSGDIEPNIQKNMHHEIIFTTIKPLKSQLF